MKVLVQVRGGCGYVLLVILIVEEIDDYSVVRLAVFSSKFFSVLVP